MKIKLSCCLCNAQKEFEIDSNGWEEKYDTLHSGMSFCPDHILIKDWSDSQCCGCVGGWGECTLWRDFAYKGERKLTPSDFEKISEGICPRRTNGTIICDTFCGSLKRVDISKKASKESGRAFVSAIKN